MGQRSGGYVYKITNLVNGKVYIGKTSGSIDQRFAIHKKNSRDRQSRLYSAMRKYGFDSFRIEQIDEVLTDLALNEIEVSWIAFFHSMDERYGYNMTCGGDGGRINLGKKQSQEWIDRKVASLKRNPDRNVWKYKKHHSEESKRAISDSQKGRTFTEDHKVKLRHARLRGAHG